MFIIPPSAKPQFNGFNARNTCCELTNGNVRPVDAFLTGFPLNPHFKLNVGGREKTGNEREEENAVLLILEKKPALLEKRQLQSAQLHGRPDRILGLNANTLGRTRDH